MRLGAWLRVPRRSVHSALRPGFWTIDIWILTSRDGPLSPVGLLARRGQGRGGSHQFISLSAFHSAGIAHQGMGLLLMTIVSHPMCMPISQHLHVQRSM